MDWIGIPETLKNIESNKEAGTSCFILQLYSYDRFPFTQEGIFYFGWYSIEEIITKWLCLDYNIVILFSAKDNIKFPDIEMERKFKDLGDNIEFNPDDKYSRLSMEGAKLFELPKDVIESCYVISNALAQQKLKIAIVIQRAEILLSDASIDYRLLDSIKSWITGTNSHTLILLTDNKENIHREIRQINSPLMKHLEWKPPTKNDFEKLFTDLQVIKPHLFEETNPKQLASACEGIHYIGIETLLNRLEKEKEVLSEALLRNISENARKEVVKTKVGNWIVIEKPGVTFDMIAGLEDVKKQIQVKLIYPFRYPDLLKNRRIKIGGGLLLYGPPGTGKTMLGKAIATEVGAPFFNITAADIKNMYLGQSENNVKKLFAEAGMYSPFGIIFIDEIDSLIPKRGFHESAHMGGVVSQFLTEMDGLNTGKQTPVLVIGATNRPLEIDSAALRPGRFDNKILVPLPDKETRKQIFRLNLHNKLIVNTINYSALAEQTEGYSGADIAHICNKVEEELLFEDVKEKNNNPITMGILKKAIHSTTPSVSRKEMEWFREFDRKRC